MTPTNDERPACCGAGGSGDVIGWAAQSLPTISLRTFSFKSGGLFHGSAFRLLSRRQSRASPSTMGGRHDGALSRTDRRHLLCSCRR